VVGRGVQRRAWARLDSSKNYLHDFGGQGFFVKDQPTAIDALVFEDNLIVRQTLPCDPTSLCPNGQLSPFQVFGPVKDVSIRLYSRAYAACTSPKTYSGLSTGSHTFVVRATDPAGNTDGSASSYTWTVTDAGTDRQPVAAFVHSPTAPVTGEAVTFDARTSTCANTPCTYTWVDDGNDGPAGGQWPPGSGRLLTTAGPPRRGRARD
jgi:hypothetical protein